MEVKRKPRVVALIVVEHNGKILVSTGYDEVKKEHFFRPIGGGVEFLERVEDTVKREFQEEIGVDVEVDKRLGVTENIFNFNGNDGHEIVFIYSGKIADKDYKEKYHFNDDGKDIDAVWVAPKEFVEGNKIIYPQVVKDYLK